MLTYAMMQQHYPDDNRSGFASPYNLLPVYYHPYFAHFRRMYVPDTIWNLYPHYVLPHTFISSPSNPTTPNNLPLNLPLPTLRRPPPFQHPPLPIRALQVLFLHITHTLTTPCMSMLPEFRVCLSVALLCFVAKEPNLGVKQLNARIYEADSR